MSLEDDYNKIIVIGEKSISVGMKTQAAFQEKQASLLILEKADEKLVVKTF